MIHRPVPYEVAVGLAAGVQPGVEAVRHLVGGQHAYVKRQRGVERAHEALGRDGRREPAAGHLRRGVYPGVGAAGTGDVHRRPFDRREHRLELSLHGPMSRLALPAGEVGAVVGHDQAQRAGAVGHRFLLSARTGLDGR